MRCIDVNDPSDVPLCGRGSITALLKEQGDVLKSILEELRIASGERKAEVTEPSAKTAFTKLLVSKV